MKFWQSKKRRIYHVHCWNCTEESVDGMMLNAAKTLTKEILELAGEDYIDNFSLKYEDYLDFLSWRILGINFWRLSVILLPEKSSDSRSFFIELFHWKKNVFYAKQMIIKSKTDDYICGEMFFSNACCKKLRPNQALWLGFNSGTLFSCLFRYEGSIYGIGWVEDQ